jgi:hypothetical protein
MPTFTFFRPCKLVGGSSHRTAMIDSGSVASSFALLTLLTLLSTGCDNAIRSEYGFRTGRPKTSVNGTTVLAEMFEEAGYDVVSRSYISARLKDFDVVVWMPDDFEPPSIAQRVGIESWLSRGNRTLIYVGRDYDALPHYWSMVAEDAPLDQQLELWRRRGFAKSSFARQREVIPDQAMARWFLVSVRGQRETVRGLVAKDPTWTNGIDVAKLEIEVRSYFVIPVRKDLQAALKGPSTRDVTEYSVNFDNSFDELGHADAKRQRSLAASFSVLLASENGTPLVTEVREPAWGSGKILVVPNGSFLLNLPLVNHEHRKLAQRMIMECQGDRVGFLHTDSFDRDMHSGSESGTLPGIALLGSWPLGIIIVHAFLLGVLLCFAWFPILGRPSEGEQASTSDFGKHIKAVGSLLVRVADREHAFRVLTEYQNHRSAGSKATPDISHDSKPKQ